MIEVALISEVLTILMLVLEIEKLQIIARCLPISQATKQDNCASLKDIDRENVFNGDGFNDLALQRNSFTQKISYAVPIIEKVNPK